MSLLLILIRREGTDAPRSFRRLTSIVPVAGRTFHNVQSRNLYRSSNSGIALDAQDPIRDVLALARPRAVVPAPLRAEPPWAVRYSPFPHIKLGVVVEGECWLCIDGLEALLLTKGDFYLLGNPPPYGLGSSIEAARNRNPDGPLRESVSASRATTSQDSATYTCSVDFEFQDSDSSALFSSLPTVTLVKAGDTDEKLLWNIVTLLIHEIERQKVGRSLVLEHLSQILLVQMLRSHAGSSHEPLGWLASVADDGIGAALRAMHAEPGRRWTLEELAKIATMSRSAFAAAFKSKVGRPPSDYLIEWRMQLARAALHTEDSLAAIAAATGYRSESAFSTAFRRVVGMSPREFRKALRPQRRVRTDVMSAPLQGAAEDLDKLHS